MLPQFLVPYLRGGSAYTLQLSPFRLALSDLWKLSIERYIRELSVGMAATALRFSCLALRHISRIPAKRKPKTPNTPIQKFHTTSLRKDDEPSNTHIPRKAASNPFKFDLSTLDSSEREIYDSLDNEKKQQWRDISQEEHEYMNSPEVESNLQGFASNAAYDTSQEIPHYDIKIPRIKSGIFAMGEVEEQDSGEDEEFEGDDITSHAHGDLEQHREMREYARIAAWEMPLLSSTPPAS